MSKQYHFTITAHALPAYGRKPVQQQDAIDWFKRGWDFVDAMSGKYFSIRDCAPGCIVQIRYGKQLQKTCTYTIPTEAESCLARLQTLDPFPSDNDVRHALAGFRPTRSQLNKWELCSNLKFRILQLR